MARIHLYPFPDEVHHAAKVAAFKSGLTLKKWIEIAMREKLRNDANPKTTEERLDEIFGEEE